MIKNEEIFSFAEEMEASFCKVFLKICDSIALIFAPALSGR